MDEFNTCDIITLQAVRMRWSRGTGIVILISPWMRHPCGDAGNQQGPRG